MAKRGAGNAGWFGQSSREKANQMDAELGLRENNEHLDALSEQVAMLKGLTMESACARARARARQPRATKTSPPAAVDEEVKSQNSFLETMGSGMGGAGSALGRTMAALEEMTSSGGGRFGFLVAVAVVAFFVLVWWATTRVVEDPGEVGAP